MGGDGASICEPLRHDIPTNNGTTSIRAGFGASGLSNLGRTISDASALATLTVEWNAGYSYFDTSPIYGYGLSELRLGQFLRRPKSEIPSATVNDCSQHPWLTSGWSNPEVKPRTITVHAGSGEGLYLSTAGR